MLALLTLLYSFFPVALAAPGDVDQTFVGFSSDGIVTASSLNGRGMVIQPDGKMVIVGYPGGTSVDVLRYLPNGQPDSTLGGDGRVTIPAPTGMEAITPYDVAVQADGRIVVAGHNTTSIGNAASNFLLMRLTHSGQLDPTFGNGGFVLTDFSNDSDVAEKVLIQPDGKIVAAGSAYGGSLSYTDFAVARYTTGGILDNTFGGGDGKVKISFDISEFAHDIVLQSNGKLVVVGASYIGNNHDFAVARLETDGTLDDNSNGDGGFSGDGKLTTGFGDEEEATAVAVQADGKIIVAGHAFSDSPKKSFIARFKSNGDLDGTFGSGGKLTLPAKELWDLALQPDGKMLTLGWHTPLAGGNRQYALHRLLPNGAPDTTFDGDGIASLDLSGFNQGKALALQPDGRILAMGNNQNDMNLVRLWPDGTTFDTGGQQTHGLAFPPTYQPGHREVVNGLALQPNSSFLVAGQLYAPNYAFSDAFVTRFTSDGLVEAGFGVNGSARVTSGVFSAAKAVVVQPDGKVVIAGYSAFNAAYTVMDFLVARFNPNGTPDASFGTNGVTLVDFANGPDAGTALALTPDGKIVVAGQIQGSRSIWGVVRLTGSGQPDNSFGGNGKAYVDFNGSNALNAVVVQSDGKIIVGGTFNGDFALHRLLENGPSDPGFGSNGGGYNFTNMGGTDSITALALAPNGWIYAAGHRTKPGDVDMALAQYTPEGILASCSDLGNCHNWPSGTFFVNQGINDYAYALDLRGDNQLVAAGCVNQHFAAVQVRTDGDPTPLPFNTDFVGYPDCAKGVKFMPGTNKIVLVGDQDLYPFSSDSNIALARFETTVNTPGPNPNPTPPPTSTVYPVYLPIIMR
jgi:uncharacterized delta-60 repeat protein